MKNLWSESRLKMSSPFAMLIVLGLVLGGCGGTEETISEEDNTGEEPTELATEETETAETSEAPGTEEQYTFTVSNETDSELVELNASETQETWLPFDLGGTAVKTGESITLVWDESTNDSNCEWWVQGVFADGSSVGPKAFDFCEEVELVFYNEEEASTSSATGSTTDVFLSTYAQLVEEVNDTGLTALAQEFSDDETIEIARGFCSAIDDGASIDDYFTTWSEDPDIASLSAAEQEMLGTYLGVVTISGTAVYCPRYGDQVAAWFEAL